MPRFLATIMCALSAALAAADPGPQRLDLPTVLMMVHDHDPALAAARADARAAEQTARSAGSYLPPQLGLQLMGLGPAAADLPQSNQHQWTLTQDLPFPGRTWAQGRVAGRLAAAKAADADSLEQQEYKDARTAFYSLAGAEFLLRGLDSVSQATREMARLSSRRAGFGQLNRMGQFMDAMLAMEDSGVDGLRPMAQQQRKAAQAMLQRLMGTDPLLGLPPAGVSLDAMLALPAPELAAALKAAEERSPLLKGASASLQAAEAARGLALSGWLPDLMVQGSVTADQAGNEQSGAMLALSLPWLWYPKQAGEAGAAAAAEDKACADLQGARLALREQVAAAVGDLNAAAESLRTAWTRTYPQAARGLELARSGFRTTALGSSEILMAVQDYRTTEEGLAGLIAQWGEAQARLLMLTAAPLGAADPDQGARP